MDIAFFTYMSVMAITPGPNNIMLAASGVNYGIRRTLPHMFGVCAGHGIQVFLVALSLGTALLGIKAVRPFLATAGCLYLLFLSWKIAFAEAPEKTVEGKVMGFWGAVIFQWLNPKAWIAILNTTVLFMPKDLPLVPGAGILAVLCSLITLPCVAVWVFGGDRLRLLLKKDALRRTFNYVMGFLMAATSIWLLVEELLPLFAIHR